MAPATLNRMRSGLWPMVALFVLLLVSLYYMSDATHNSVRFGQLYSWLLLTNAMGVIVLIALIGANLYWLVCQYRVRAAGSLLTARLVGLFVLLAVVPVVVVYYFSIQFLNKGIDSWFDVQIEQALNDSLELSRSAFDIRLRDLLHVTEEMADELSEEPAAAVPLSVYDLRVRSGATEVTVFEINGRIIASSSEEDTTIVPNRPPDNVIQQVRRNQPYVGLDPFGEAGLYVRAAAPIAAATTIGEPRLLQALYRIPDRFSSLANNVQNAVVRYKELAYLRQPLKHSYTLTLSVVLLLSLLAAVWAAFYAARRMVAPVRNLAEGTRAVAAGNLEQQVPQGGDDELGFLVQSFNEMTERLSRARDAAARSRQQVESQRGYLEALLGSLSSGVLGLANDGRLRSANGAASRILQIDFAEYRGKTLASLAQSREFLLPFVEAVEHWNHDEPGWRGEVTLFGPAGRQVLMCQCALLPATTGESGGQVVVFDDITALIQAQRDAAWGEAARRLAHEIKNPLTPIQLSAERLRRKYLDTLPDADREVLDRATHTIVQQVLAMKDMVNVFRDYARMPSSQLEPVRLNRIVGEVLDLYRGSQPAVQMSFDLDPDDPLIAADQARIRQLLHNLVKNALEAMADSEQRHLEVTTRCFNESGANYVELVITDSGTGIPEGLRDTLFDPYVTDKPSGTGLGLAIVKKIVDEHGGVIGVENVDDGGARICIRLQVMRSGSRV